MHDWVRVRALRPLTRHEWRVSLLLFFSYIPVSVISLRFFPEVTQLSPATALAVCGLFFGGLRLWPVVALASIVSGAITGAPTLPLLYLASMEVLQANAGAYMLRWLRIDPLFRSYRDMFGLLGAVAALSVIAPTARGMLRALYYHVPLSGTAWGHAYVATVFCLIIISPFILRWFAKPSFSRPLLEWVEVGSIFALLLSLSSLLFVSGLGAILGVPTLYLLFVPLLWIALRHRPRFVTLALLLCALIALHGVRMHVPPHLLPLALFQLELLFIMLSGLFLIIVSLEEDRRLNRNLMRSQLSTLENAVARISSESKSKNDFIAILAHELRNPLAPIVSAIDLLRLREGIEEDEAETLTMMENRMKTVRRLLDDLLDVSRISEGKIVLNIEPVKLKSIIKRAVLSTVHHRLERHQTLSVHEPEDTLTISGDPVRLEQIFSNLLTNASKYSDPGDHIELTVVREGNRAIVTVRDEGVGIPPDALERIFDPFQQIGSGARTQKGLGIGLALVESFVSLHGGMVTALSEGVGRGSTFRVSLPLRSEAGALSTPSVGEVAASSSAQVPSTVLIVQDNDVEAWSIGRLLEMRDYQVNYAYDAGQAIARAEEKEFGIILIDTDLPRDGAFQAAQLLRASGFTGMLIALVRAASPETEESVMLAGFTSLLQKPVRLDDLTQMLSRHE